MEQFETRDELSKATMLRADELFVEHQQKIYRSTDRLFAGLMLFQWLASIVASVIISPRTWIGDSSQVHIHVWAAIFLGGAISVFPCFHFRADPAFRSRWRSDFQWRHYRRARAFWR